MYLEKATLNRFLAPTGEAQLGLNIFRGSSEIVPMLVALGPHAFGSKARAPTDVDWNVLVLRVGDEKDSYPCVFLSSCGSLSREIPQGEHRLSFDQYFLLCKPDLPENER